MSIFKAGDKVRINYPESDWNGRICTYKHPDTNQQIDIVSHFVTDDAIPGGVGKWIQTRYLELLTAAPKEDEYAAMSLEEQVAKLTEELYQVSRSYVAASTHRDRLQHDIDLFTSTMRDVKETEGWCDDGSNRIIMQLNDEFQTYFIEPFQQEFEVEYEINAGVIVRGTVMVMASSQDAAEEFFKDDINSYIEPHQLAKNEVNNLGWDSIDTEVI